MDEELQKISEWGDQVKIYLIENGVRIFIALIIVAVGIWLSRIIGDSVIRFCQRRNLDPTLSRFFAGAIRLLIVLMAFILALGRVGIEITPFVALIGASAFGLSLAVQGPVSNYGAGIVLTIVRPFKVGDTLTLQGLCGLVESINLGNTCLINEDEEIITIPNRKVLGEILINSGEHRIFEGIVGVDYGSNPQEAIDCIARAIKTVKGVAAGREPDVGIDAFGDSSIDIGYRVWVPTCRYHKTRYAINQAVFEALKEADITIPFPQRDLHFIGKSPPLTQ